MIFISNPNNSPVAEAFLLQLSPKYRDLCDKQHYLHLKLWRNLYLHVLCKWWKNYQFKLITDQSVLFCSGEALVVRIDLKQTGYKFNDNLYNSRSGPHNAQKRNRAQGGSWPLVFCQLFPCIFYALKRVTNKPLSLLNFCFWFFLFCSSLIAFWWIVAKVFWEPWYI